MTTARRITWLARAAVVLALVLLVLGWWQLGRLAENVESAARIGAGSGTTVSEAMTITAELTRDVRALTGSVSDALADADALLAAAIRAGDTAEQALAEDLPGALRGLSATADRLARGGSALQDAVELLPGDQDLSFGDDLQSLADGLRPLPTTVEGIAGSVAEAVDALGPLRGDLSVARTQLTQLQVQLAELAERMDALAAEAEQATADLEDAAERSDVRLFWWRVLLVVGVLVMVAFAAGLELLGRELARDVPGAE